MPASFRFVLMSLLVVACSATESPPIATALCGDAAADAPPACHLVVIAGQSNAGWPGRSSELTGDDVALADPFEPVVELARYSTSSAPLDWTEYGPTPTQPLLWQSTQQFGIELTMARDLVAARPGVEWRIAKAAAGATSLAQTWNPSHSLPSVFDDVHTWFGSLAADCPIAAYVWIQGEKDANQVSFANAYGSNLAGYVDAMRARLGAVPFIYGRLNDDTAATYVTTVRAGQEALSRSDVHLIDQDPYTLRADGIHYTTTGTIGLGHDYATAVLMAVPE